MTEPDSSFWNPGVQLRHMYTPLERCVGLRPGTVDRVTVEDLRRRSFDQAPVFGGPRGAIGVVLTDDLEQLIAAGDTLREGHPKIDSTSIHPEPLLSELLETMSPRRACLVVSAGRADGLLTISDLNRHPL